MGTVEFVRGGTSGIASKALKDGQILFDKDNRTISLDVMVDGTLTRITMAERTFNGTSAQWEALSDAQKSVFTYVNLTDDYEGNIDVMTGATASANGAAGYVPTPLAGDEGKFLKGNASWATLADVASSGDAEDLTYDNTDSGLTSTNAQDAIDEIVSEVGGIEELIPDTATSSNKLATMADVTGGGSASDIGYDNTTSGLTADDVQDAIDEVVTALGGKADTSDLGTAAALDAPASGNAGSTEVVLGSDTRLTDSRNAADVYSWAKAETKPTYTASEIGLGNVGNFKAVSTVASQGLTSTEQENARANIGAGVSNFDGAYSSLTGTPTLGTAAAKDSTNAVTENSTDLVESGAVYTALGSKADSSDLATVATSGAYSDLSGTPTLGTASEKDVASSGDASSTQVVMGNDSRLTDARNAADVSAWAKESTKPTYTAAEVGAIATTAKGTASGVAELDATGKVPSSQLPSYVDDVIEGYYDTLTEKFYEDSSHTIEITGETGKIYVDLEENKSYRWSGSAFIVVGGGGDLVLGETSSTAYRGDRGKTAYDHATDSSRLTTAQSSGLYKIATTAEGHVASVTAVEKADITALGIPAQDTIYNEATTSADGLMSSSDKTKLNGIASGAEVNVQSDWDVTDNTSDAFIKNKPTIPSVTGKADKVSGATSGNFAGLDSNGNLTDSGSKAGDFAAASHNQASNTINAMTGYSKASTANQDITTSDTLNVAIGKLEKTLSEKGTSNFSGSYTDLTNKPTLGTAAAKDVPSSGNASTTQVVMGDDTRLSDSRRASDVYSWAKASVKPTYTASEVGAAKAPTELSTTLYSGSTQVSFNNSAFSSSTSKIDIYTNKPGLNYSGISVSGNYLYITYPAQTSNVTVMVVIR